MSLAWPSHEIMYDVRNPEVGPFATRVEEWSLPDGQSQITVCSTALRASVAPASPFLGRPESNLGSRAPFDARPLRRRGVKPSRANLTPQQEEA